MRKILAMIALGLSFLASPLAAQTASSGEALRVNQTVTSPPNAVVQVAPVTVNINGPRSDAAFPGPTPADADSALGINQNIDLSGFGLGLRERLVTSALSTSAMASATQATGTARVNDLNFSLGTDNISLLSITAMSVQSTTTATVSPIATSGTTTITGLQLNGSVFGPTNTLTLTADQQAAFTAGTPNLVIFEAAGIRITLNRQVETATDNGDGTITLTRATDAIAVQFTNAPVGTGLKNGELLIASSSASATAISP